MTTTTATPRLDAALRLRMVVLAGGDVAVGTGAFVIAGVLPPGRGIGAGRRRHRRSADHRLRPHLRGRRPAAGLGAEPVPAAPAPTLAMNAPALYLGSAFGAVVGAVVLAAFGLRSVPLAGGGLALLALVALGAGELGRRRRT